MTECPALKISSGGVTAALAPSLGGAVLSAADAEGPLLRLGTAPTVAADPRASGCFPCVPWFGRLNLQFDGYGRTAWLKATLPDASSLALHGDGWISAWEVLAHTDDRLLCRISAPSTPSGFPFAYSAEQELLIRDGGLQIRLTLRNSDLIPMPAGLGLHPYFRRTPTTQVAFSSARIWAPPVEEERGRLSALTSALGSGGPASLPDRTLDLTFIEFDGEAIIVDEVGAVRVTSEAPFLHVYAPAGAAFFCLEPVSHLPGLFLADESHGGARSLAPGEEMSLSLFVDRPH